MPITRVVTYPNEIDRILGKPGGPLGVRIRRLALDIAAEAKTLSRSRYGNRHPADAPRTGKLAESYTVKVKIVSHRSGAPGFEFLVGNSVPYFRPQELGSPPHLIYPRRAKALRFRSRQTGQWVTRSVVFHPGTKGEHIMMEAADRVMTLSGLKR